MAEITLPDPEPLFLYRVFPFPSYIFSIPYAHTPFPPFANGTYALDSYNKLTSLEPREILRSSAIGLEIPNLLATEMIFFIPEYFAI